MNGFGKGLDSQKNSSSGFESGITLAKSTVSRGIQLFLDSGHNGSYSGSGNTWKDISGNGKVATLYNTPTYSATNSGILTFAKASFQYAETTTNLGNMPNWTVEAWIKLNSNLTAGQNAIITNIFDGLNLNYSLGSNIQGNINPTAGFFNGAWRNAPASGVLVVGTWYHLVGTYDGATISYYVNASLENTLSYSGIASSGGNTRIARRWDSPDNDSGNFVDGTIPIVRIYNRALFQAEVTRNFNQSRGRYGI